jgi:hypothetical protein
MTPLQIVEADVESDGADGAIGEARVGQHAVCAKLFDAIHPLDTRKLQLFTDLTKELVAFIDLDRAATAQKVRDATSSRSSRANSTG